MLNTIKKIAGQIKNFAVKHKIISLIIFLILLGSGYWGYSSLNGTSGINRYVLAEVTKGTIISTVSGTGQVSASDTISIKPEVSGKITYLNITKDKQIKSGTLLAKIESRDAQNAVDSAENDLANAKLSSTDVAGDAKDTLDTAYDSGLDALATTFKDLVTMKSDLDSMFLDSSYNGADGDIDYYLGFVSFYNTTSEDMSFWNNNAEQKYTDLQNKLDLAEETEWTINRSSDSSKIKSAVTTSYNSTKNFLDLIRQASNLTQRYQKLSDAKSLTTPISTSTTTTQMTSLSADITTLAKDVTSLQTAKSDISTAQATYSKISVNTQAQEISIQKYKNALSTAKENLAKYSIYSTIDGVIATTDDTIKTGDTVSSGTALGSIVTKNEVVEISLNEVDAIKVKTGQKATITFDALSDVTATGSVADVDTVGTVSSGVVSYSVKVALDVENSQIKPGMSASVNIITDTQQNVLTVPNSAVKTKNGANYVLVLSQAQDLTISSASQGFTSKTTPTQKTVVIGVADDTNTQITSGLAEGDQIVTRTISGTKTTTTTTSSSSTSKTTKTATQTLTGGSAGGPPGGF